MQKQRIQDLLQELLKALGAVCFAEKEIELGLNVL